MIAADTLALVVDDEFMIAELFVAQLEQIGVKVCGTAASAAEAIALALQFLPRFVLMDVRLKGDQDGVDAAVAIHKQVGAGILYITGSREPATLARIARLHPAPVLFKPIQFAELKRAVLALLAV